MTNHKLRGLFQKSVQKAESTITWTKYKWRIELTMASNRERKNCKRKWKRQTLSKTWSKPLDNRQFTMSALETTRFGSQVSTKTKNGRNWRTSSTKSALTWVNLSSKRHLTCKSQKTTHFSRFLTTNVIWSLWLKAIRWLRSIGNRNSCINSTRLNLRDKD